MPNHDSHNNSSSFFEYDKPLFLFAFSWGVRHGQLRLLGVRRCLLLQLRLVVVLYLFVFMDTAVVDHVHHCLVGGHRGDWGGILPNSDRALPDKGSLDRTRDWMSIGDSVNT